jgi:hypothetical protein
MVSSLLISNNALSAIKIRGLVLEMGLEMGWKWAGNGNVISTGLSYSTRPLPYHLAEGRPRRWKRWKRALAKNGRTVVIYKT